MNHLIYMLSTYEFISVFMLDVNCLNKNQFQLSYFVLNTCKYKSNYHYFLQPRIHLDPVPHLDLIHWVLDPSPLIIWNNDISNKSFISIYEHQYNFSPAKDSSDSSGSSGSSGSGSSGSGSLSSGSIAGIAVGAVALVALAAAVAMVVVKKKAASKRYEFFFIIWYYNLFVQSNLTHFIIKTVL